MNEQKRLEELLSYDILDTPEEKELDDIAEITSAICDTPIALITLLDDERQWFKANKGLDIKETLRKDSFCQYALTNPDEVFVVDNPLEDSRFVDNPLVTGSPFIRFYAGAPLETPNGTVLGTLCVIDNKAKDITENQKKALQLLAKKAMDFLNARKQVLLQKKSIASNAAKLKRLTDQAPGVIFQLELTAENNISIPFISEGISRLHLSIDQELIKTCPKEAFKSIYSEDLPIVLESIRNSYCNLSDWYAEYRVVCDDGRIAWHMGKAKPEKEEDGSVVWFGTIQDISRHVEYQQTMEQIAFDISHVLRRPVTSLLGLTSVIEAEKEMNQNMIKEYCRHIHAVSKELEEFTSKLNSTYDQKKKIITGHQL